MSGKSWTTHEVTFVAKSSHERPTSNPTHRRPLDWTLIQVGESSWHRASLNATWTDRYVAEVLPSQGMSTGERSAESGVAEGFTSRTSWCKPRASSSSRRQRVETSRPEEGFRVRRKRREPVTLLVLEVESPTWSAHRSARLGNEAYDCCRLPDGLLQGQFDGVAIGCRHGPNRNLSFGWTPTARRRGEASPAWGNLRQDQHRRRSTRPGDAAQFTPGNELEEVNPADKVTQRP